MPSSVATHSTLPRDKFARLAHLHESIFVQLAILDLRSNCSVRQPSSIPDRMSLIFRLHPVLVTSRFVVGDFRQDVNFTQSVWLFLRISKFLTFNLYSTCALLS